MRPGAAATGSAAPYGNVIGPSAIRRRSIATLPEFFPDRLSPCIFPSTHRRARRRPAVQLSVIVPFLNEREVLPACLQRLRRVLDGLNESYEIVFVDDGSRDGSAEFLAARIRTEPGLKLLRLSRNFGKEAAMTAGIEHAVGAAIVILDADLQDPPELIPDMVRAWREGADVVCMRRRSRAGESWLKRASAYAYYRLLNRLSKADIPADTGDFRLMSRKAVQALLQLPERCRYMKGMYAWIGLPTRILDYDRDPRAAAPPSGTTWA